MKMSIKQRLISAVLIAITMSGCISAVMTIINLGITSTFFTSWFRTWRIAFSIAAPVSFVIPPAVTKFVMKLEI